MANMAFDLKAFSAPLASSLVVHLELINNGPFFERVELWQDGTLHVVFVDEPTATGIKVPASWRAHSVQVHRRGEIDDTDRAMETAFPSSMA